MSRSAQERKHREWCDRIRSRSDESLTRGINLLDGRISKISEQSFSDPTRQPYWVYTVYHSVRKFLRDELDRRMP